MFEHWEVGAGGLMGAAFMVAGVIIRAGRYHVGVHRTYMRRDLPDYQRNAVFALIPIGTAFVVISAAAGLMQTHGTLDTGTDPDPLPNLLMLLGAVALVMGLWWSMRPPALAKPAWVREYDRAEKAGEPVPDFSPPPMSPRAYMLNWLGLAAMAVVWLALQLPLGALLIGLCIGASLLLANRPRRA